MGSSSQRYTEQGNIRAEGVALIYANSNPGLKRERNPGGVIHGYDGARAKQRVPTIWVGCFHVERVASEIFNAGHEKWIAQRCRQVLSWEGKGGERNN